MTRNVKTTNLKSEPLDALCVMAHPRGSPLMRGILLGILRCLSLPSVIWGDGIQFKGDRVQKDTKATVLTLSRDQLKLLATQAKELEKYDTRKIQLTEEQKQILRKEAGSSPNELTVWPLSCAKDTCTCEVINMGIRFKTSQIEVPHFLLERNVVQRHKSPPQQPAETNASPNAASSHQ